METKDFAGNPVLTRRAESHLVEGERLVALFHGDMRDMVLTSERLILLERAGGWSVIRNSQISAIEVSDGRGQERFVKVHFGGGLSRTVGVSGDEEARALASAAAFG